MHNIMKQYVADTSGATAIEYGLIAALVAVGLVAAATSLGDSIKGLLGKTTTAVTAVDANI